MDSDNLVVIGGGLVIGAIALFSGGGENARGFLQGDASIKDIRNSMLMDNAITQTKQEAMGQREEIALQRYQSGCIPHLKKADIQRPEDKAIGSVTVWPMPVREGDAPVDWQGVPYSPGAVVCDERGGTALVDIDGSFTDYAFTGQDVGQFWDQNMQRWR